MPRSFVRGVRGWIRGFGAAVILEVGDLRWSGLAWYRFAKGEALRCGFLFAFEPVEDCLSAFLLVFLDDRLDPPVCDQVVKGHYYCALDADPAASISAPAM